MYRFYFWWTNIRFILANCSDCCSNSICNIPFVQQRSFSIYCRNSFIGIFLFHFIILPDKYLYSSPTSAVAADTAAVKSASRVRAKAKGIHYQQIKCKLKINLNLNIFNWIWNLIRAYTFPESRCLFGSCSLCHTIWNWYVNNICICAMLCRIALPFWAIRVLCALLFRFVCISGTQWQCMCVGVGKSQQDTVYVITECKSLWRLIKFCLHFQWKKGVNKME